MNLSEYTRATSLPYSSLLKELNIWGEAFLIQATCVQHADANRVQLVLGGSIDECISFLLVVKYLDPMPGGKRRARP